MDCHRQLRTSWSRRAMVQALGGGLGAVGLAPLLGPDLIANAAASPGPAALRAAGQARHPPVHERRPVPGGPLRPEAGPQQVRRPAARRKSTSAPRTQTGGLLPVPFSFQPRGQSGLPVSELLPHLGALHRRPVRPPLAAHRQPEPRAGPVPDEQRHDHADPAEHGLVAARTAWAPRTQNLPGYVVLCPGRPVRFAELWSSGFLPGEYQGTYINHSQPRPAEDDPAPAQRGSPTPTPAAAAARPAAAS